MNSQKSDAAPFPEKIILPNFPSNGTPNIQINIFSGYPLAEQKKRNYSELPAFSEKSQNQISSKKSKPDIAQPIQNLIDVFFQYFQQN